MDNLFLKKIKNLCFQSNLEQRRKKIKIYRELFLFIKDNIELLNKYKKMKQIIKYKLIGFYHFDNLRQAGVWYRWIFNKRIPYDI